MNRHAPPGNYFETGSAEALSPPYNERMKGTMPRNSLENFRREHLREGMDQQEQHETLKGFYAGEPLNPLVSILINNYNYGRFLGPCIESCLAQDYPHVEIVVVDDGSKDNSVEIARSYPNVKVVTKENGGQASAFDAGVANSRGMVLCFLDSDDTFMPDKVSSVVSAFKKKLDGGPVLVYHRMLKMDEEGNTRPAPRLKRIFGALRTALFSLSGQRRKLSTPARTIREIERGGYAFSPWPRPTSCIVINRAMALKVFPLGAEGTRAFADLILLRTASLYGPCYEYLRELMRYRLHSSSVTHTKKEDTTEEAVIRILNEHLSKLGRKPNASLGSAWYYSDMVTKGDALGFIRKARANGVPLGYTLRLVAMKGSKRVLAKMLRREETV